jgi:glutamate/tyrosine decarboxylase-like PLP-dependent enzyme
MSRYTVPDISHDLREIPAHTTSPRLAARIVNNDLLLDGVPGLNRAGFATTYMEPEIEAVMIKNLVRCQRSVSLVGADFPMGTAEKHHA